MKRTGKKRQILAASLLIALAAAVTVNWYYSRSVPETTTDPSQPPMLGDTVLVAGTNVENAEETTGASVEEADAAAFSKLELKQTEARDRLEEKIEAVLSTEQLDEAAQQEIRSLLEQYRAQTETRTNCETLISAKVGGRAIVLLDADAGRVIVERGRLNDQTTLQITEIMQTNAHISPENLTILEVNS